MDRDPHGVRQVTILMLDFDRPQAPRLTKLCWQMRKLALRPRLLMYRRSRRGWHIVIYLTESLLPVEMVAVQAIMGSDRNRELFNLARVRCLKGMPARARQMWNVLFDHKINR